jgi:hypothetical protein
MDHLSFLHTGLPVDVPASSPFMPDASLAQIYRIIRKIDFLLVIEKIEERRV